MSDNTAFYTHRRDRGCSMFVLRTKVETESWERLGSGMTDFE